MRKIKLVILHNFKSHAHSEIPFDDFTAIIGPSNSGKSTVFKAIRLCLYNEPSGDRFITHGEKLCYVEVRFDDNSGIRRTRGKDDQEINLYEIIHTDGKVDPYTNFGAGPVAPIIAFHGMPKVNLFGEEECLNMADQFSAPFLLTSTSEKRAKMIGKIAKTDVADLALSNLNSEVRNRTALKKKYTKELKEKHESLKELKDLPYAESLIDSLDLKLDKAKNIDNRLRRIMVIQKELEALTKKKDSLFDFIQKEADINNLINQLDGILALDHRMTKIITIQRNLIKAIGEKDATQRLIDTVDMDQLGAICIDMDKLLSVTADVFHIQKIQEKLESEIKRKGIAEKTIKDVPDVDLIVSELENCRSTLLSLNNILSIKSKLDTEKLRVPRGREVIANLEKQYTGKFEIYKQALIDNKQCPVCQSEITEEKVAAITDLM
ncbi:MAG: hypothetical protein K0R00_230 [Herbinix sp.]|jgi:exonuclease SbcC|nr:hypothetical protein [Herbinix sp.]